MRENKSLLPVHKNKSIVTTSTQEKINCYYQYTRETQSLLPPPREKINRYYQYMKENKSLLPVHEKK